MRRLALIAVVLLLTGCPGNQRGEDFSKSSPPKTTTTTANPQAMPERTAAAAPEIQVQLIEYEIRMPDTLAAGPQTFHVANAGKQNHNFAIEGNNLSTKLSSDLTRGGTNDVTIDLKPGTYTVYCPVDKHRGRGMQRTITVHQ
jgi:uncharacterized cupredoxin-like copper-binding protein